jgi:hypothetical protein
MASRKSENVKAIQIERSNENLGRRSASNLDCEPITNLRRPVDPALLEKLTSKVRQFPQSFPHHTPGTSEFRLSIISRHPKTKNEHEKAEFRFRFSSLIRFGLSNLKLLPLGWHALESNFEIYDPIYFTLSLCHTIMKVKRGSYWTVWWV